MVVKMSKKTVHIDQESHERIKKRAKAFDTTIEQETNQIIQKELFMSELDMKPLNELVMYNSSKVFEEKVNKMLRDHPGSEPFKSKGRSQTLVRGDGKWYVLLTGLQNNGEIVKQIFTVEGTKNQFEEKTNQIEKEKPNAKLFGMSVEHSKIYAIYVYDAFKTIEVST